MKLIDILNKDFLDFQIIMTCAMEEYYDVLNNNYNFINLDDILINGKEW